MAVITISIPENLKKELDARPEVNWTEVIRNIFLKKLSALKKFENSQIRMGEKYA